MIAYDVKDIRIQISLKYLNSGKNNLGKLLLNVLKNDQLHFC